MSYADQPDQGIQDELHLARQLLLVVDQGMDVLAHTGQARLERPAGPFAGILVGVGDDAPQTLQPVAHLREPVAQTTYLAQLHPQDVVGAGGVPAAGVVGVEGVDR